LPRWTLAGVSDPRGAQARLAQAVEEVLSIASLSILRGAASGQVEIIGGHRLAILT
jgi:hypothetical protein